MKAIFATMLFAALTVPVVAQNSPIPILPFSFTSSAFTAPGGIKSFVGVDAGVQFQPNEYVSFASHNIISTDNTLSYFGGGLDYYFPAISLKVNNMTPTMSGFRLLFSLGGSFGDARVNLGSQTVQHWGEEFHGSLSYALSGGGAWQLGVRAGAARFPYFQKGWTPVVSLGPSFHF